MPSCLLSMTPHPHHTPLFANVTICSATLRSSFARGTVVRIRSCSISEVVMFLLITKRPLHSPKHRRAVRRLASQLAEVHSVLHSHTRRLFCPTNTPNRLDIVDLLYQVSQRLHPLLLLTRHSSGEDNHSISHHPVPMDLLDVT